MSSQIAQPKVFISYGWSNSDHQEWVRNLANELHDNYVDVEVDFWGLKPGNDINAFIERMVNSEVGKVLIICDKTYSEKANDRTGGVGAETFIISNEVYKQHDQSKFVAILRERDESGNPYLPTYYRGRIYIDLSESDTYSENFDRLLRWIFDKPVDEKPKTRGTPPTFLTEGISSLPRGTGSIFRKCLDGVTQNRSFAYSSFDSFCNKFIEDLEKFRITIARDKHFDDMVVGSIDALIPFRDEAVKLFVAISQNEPSDKFISRIHKFFEGILRYSEPPIEMGSWSSNDFDNYLFFAHELFLYAIATFIKHEKFEYANYLFSNQYYIPEGIMGNKEAMRGFEWFNAYPNSLGERNKRLELRKNSLRSALIKERCTIKDITFVDLQQADFVSYVRFRIYPLNRFFKWYPDTLAYIQSRTERPFEIFARARSIRYFNNIEILFDITGQIAIDEFVFNYNGDSKRQLAFPHFPLDVEALMGYSHLRTLP